MAHSTLREPSCTATPAPNGHSLRLAAALLAHDNAPVGQCLDFALASRALRSPHDAQDPTLVPVGFGTLRQDDIAVRVSLTGGLTVRAIPLDETVIRTLSPDSYRALRDIMASRRPALDSIHRRFRLPRYSVWFVSFFAQEQGETRFSPMEFIITNTGRDFRPLDLVPLTPGFGEYRLRQREVQSALFIFDGQLDVNQPLSVIVETTEGGGWSDTLKRIDRERVLIRARANRGGRDTAGSGRAPTR